MKLFNRLVALLLCVVIMAVVACLSVSAITLYPVGDFLYQKINNNTEFEIYKYEGSSSFVVTPFSHNGLPITTVGSNAFDGNSNLNELLCSNKLTTISGHAFLNCSDLHTVTFMDKTVTSIGDYAFAGCYSLNYINLENTLISTVSNGVFMNCNSLVEITLPDTVTTIEADAFINCTTLSKVLIPASVTSIESDVFSGSPNVVIYCYTDSVAHNYAVDNEIPFVLLDQQEVETYILGDSDDDGVVTVMDATTIQLFLVAKYEDSDGRLVIRSDVDFDGLVSIMDATRIQKYKADLLDADTLIGKTLEY